MCQSPLDGPRCVSVSQVDAYIVGCCWVTYCSHVDCQSRWSVVDRPEQAMGHRHTHDPLRSASLLAVAVPSTRLRTIGDRAFPTVASRTLNSLPPEVTSSTTLSTFKSKPKTYMCLCSLSFPIFSFLCPVTAVL